MHIKDLTGKAIATIEANFALLSGVDELAGQLGVAKCHLIRAFKSQAGLTPGQYLVSTRIKAAKLILCHRAYSVEAVANMVGYSGANYFCKVFRRAVGESPHAWRARQAQPPALSDTEKTLIEYLDRLSHT